MFLSELPMLLLLIYGVTSVDMNLNKRILRRNTEVTRTYNLNRPPLMENYNLIPVTVVYDDQEVIKVRTHIKKSSDINVIDDKSNLENSSAAEKSVTLKTQSANNNKLYYNFDSAAIVNNDYEEDDTLYKLKARSIKITGSEKSKTEEGNVEFETRPKRQRRRSQVRKLKVNKSQLNAYINETENSVNQKAESKIQIGRNTTSEDLEQISGRDSIQERGRTFQKRKQLRDPVIPIIESESFVFSHSGNFHYSYESGDGTRAFERGELRSSNGGAGSAVEGNFSYKDKDGNDFSLSYTADENGYRPVGAHLPTPPPIPPAIQRALDLLATKTTPEPITERVKTL